MNMLFIALRCCPIGRAGSTHDEQMVFTDKLLLTRQQCIRYNPRPMEQKIHPFSNLILDMDGVLWHGNTPVPGIIEFFDALRILQIKFVLATNNATKVSDDYARRLASYGVDVSPSSILTSSETTASYLKQRSFAGAKVYVVGEEGLATAIRNQGFHLIETEGFVSAEIRADFVVAGMTHHVCYKQLASASYLINQGAAFIGTNPDVTFPTEIGPLPGAGSILAFLETATGVKPVVVGKPNRIIFDEALRRLEGSSDDTVMVGDRLNTDIAGGHAASLRTVLLLSGISKMADVANSMVQPDWIFSDIREFTTFLQGQNQV